MKKAGSGNPVFLLDEVDKMSTDFRGDPSSALLEVLDPEQNSTFNDHYLDVDYDLSKVMFITTANTLERIPRPLQDRMEIIRIAGYTEVEKLNIAKRYLVTKQREANGSRRTTTSRSPTTRCSSIIRHYTKEAGVRNLEREIASICRKVAVEVVKKDRNAQVRVHGEEPVEVSRAAAVPLRQGRGGQQGRHGHRSGLDRAGRRAARDRGDRHARQGQADHHRHSSATSCRSRRRRR